mmetsp:Transcript_3149/g.12783  ORF Transcript_3149/g.12783 Transcript_3149/m.12783 type:complete len:413 (+) Transcript_3149:146-1384(+)
MHASTTASPSARALSAEPAGAPLRQPRASASAPTPTELKLLISPSKQRSKAKMEQYLSGGTTALIIELLVLPHQEQQSAVSSATHAYAVTRGNRSDEGCSSGIPRPRKMRYAPGIPRRTLVCAVAVRPPLGQRMCQKSPTYPPIMPPNALPASHAPIMKPASPSENPAVCRYIVMKSSAFHGMLPTAPCAHTTCSVCTRTTALTSCTVFLESFTSQRRVPAHVASLSGKTVPLPAIPVAFAPSLVYRTSTVFASAMPATTLAPPTSTNATRQPSARALSGHIGTLAVLSGAITAAATAVPPYEMMWSQPKPRPRRSSANESARTDCVAGIAAARAAPVTARSTRTAPRVGESATRRLSTPHTTQAPPTTAHRSLRSATAPAGRLASACSAARAEVSRPSCAGVAPNDLPTAA